MRHQTRKAMDRLNALLGLREEPWMQDWDILLADPDRVPEFCAIYRTQITDEDEKFTLMTLIVASYDEYLQKHSHDALIWSEIAELLRADAVLHKDTIDYWAEDEEEDPERNYEITPFIRKIREH